MGLDVRIGLQSYYKRWVSALNVNIKAPKVINITVQESPEMGPVWGGLPDSRKMAFRRLAPGVLRRFTLH